VPVASRLRSSPSLKAITLAERIMVGVDATQWLYPKGSEEKRLLDSMLLAVPRSRRR
jgi:hypothetical protein